MFSYDRTTRSVVSNVIAMFCNPVHVVSKLSRCLPTRICDEFLYTQEKSCNLLFEKEKKRLELKFLWLCDKKEAQTRVNIIPIYSVLSTPSSHDDPTLHVNNPSFSLSPSFLIFIHPDSFPSHRSSSLSTVRDGWFLNLSSFDIPINIQCFLQLNENFTLPFNNKNKIIFDCIKRTLRIAHKEYSLIRKLLSRTIPILNNIISSLIFTSPMDKYY